MSKVAVVKTTPETVLDDIRRLAKLADMSDALDPNATTILKNNISWHLMYPSANTTPWQLEGTILALKDAGMEDMVCVENKTVVTNAHKGEMLNKQRPVCEHYNVPIKYNFKKSDMLWETYKPKADMLVLDDIFPDGIKIPDYFHGKNVIHLPTVKCHIYTNMTGSMKNAFGGLLSTNRHYCHSKIHETLVDLLAIQKEIHPGIFTITDGTTAGNGPGPRTMEPICKDILIASSDCVAIDAVSAHLMGFEPMDHKCIRFAHERGLGTGRFDEIELVGDVDAAHEQWGFYTGDNAASSVGKMFWFGPLKWLQHLLFHTPIVYGFIMGSAVYHDRVWYPFKGMKAVSKWLNETHWGQHFTNYKVGR